MPIYTIELDGKQYDIQGDREPTEQEAREAVAQFQPQQQTQQQSQQRPSIIAQLLRSTMRNAPLEQMKTTQFLQQQGVPEVQQGQSLQNYQQTIAQQLQPREEDIARQGSMAQLQNPATAALLLTGANNPLQTLKGVGKFGILEGLSSISGLNQAIQGIEQPEARDIADISKVTLEGLLASQSWRPKFIKTAETKIAGRIIDSLIKPRHKEFMFGKNPGEAVAKEGIIANNMGSLKDKVQIRIDELMDDISNVRSSAENFDKKVDVSKTIQPLKDAYTYLKSVGEKTHASEITRIENALFDLTSGSGKDLTNLSISEAYQFKDAVSSMQNWASDSVASHKVNVSLRKTYHNIDAIIDKAIPKLESLNSRVSNLISANQAIDNRIEVLRRSEPMPNVLRMLNLPFEVLKTPLAKTTLGRLLATQSPRPVPKK